MKMTKDFVTKEILLRQLPYYFVVVGSYFSLAIWMISVKKYAFLGKPRFVAFFSMSAFIINH